MFSDDDFDAQLGELVNVLTAKNQHRLGGGHFQFL
jgi:hypothetical protein